ncbi:MAG TPA: cytochrome P450, partial [Puia sp.]|nr:cytochrome P450 [Puia sp.]
MKIPAKNTFTALYQLYRKGYQFIGDSCDELQTDIFQVRPPGQAIICIRGEEAASIFYDQDKMQRKGAVPAPVQQTLTGKDAIHTTDGPVHQQRKAMFLSLMTDDNIAGLQQLFNHELHQRCTHWQRQPSVNLFEEMSQALCVAICEWADVPFERKEIKRDAADFIAMIDAFGSLGWRNWKGRRARKRAESRIMKVVKEARAETIKAKPATALATVIHYREPSGQLLNDRMAAIELINILRPTVAITWYIVFAVTALHEQPEWRRRFAADVNEDQLHFIDEVRRFYPFAPFMGAKVRHDFEWRGYPFPHGAL